MSEADLPVQEVGAEAGQDAQDWKASLPEEIRSDPSLEPIRDLAGLAKSYVNAQRLIGREKIPMPKDESDPLWEDVYRRLGRPETPDAYEFERPEGLPGYDEGAEKAFREQAHKLGLSAKQARGLYDWYNSLAGEKLQGASKTREEWVSALKAEWGPSFAENVEAARRALRYHGDESLVDLLDSTGLGDHPAVVKMMAKIGKGLKEDGLRGTAGASMGADDAKRRINAILADRNHPYHDRYKPGHNEAVAEMLRLHEAAYPQEE